MVCSHLDEGLQVLVGFAADFVGKADFCGGDRERHVPPRRVFAQFGECCRADFPLRGIDDAEEGGVVVRVVDEAQVAEQVADFAVLEEAGAAADFVRQAEFAQLLFEGACLEVAAVEDGEVAVFFVVADFAQVDVLHDLFGFGFVAARADDVYALACRQL